MWRFATARATGTSHLRAGLPCQDRLACTVLNDGTLVAAVADGAGSAPAGDLG
ncbi:MAG TPA: protein phosphatase 2C domain-containing protein, partial [Enterovirga sp.]|nr:protein phosphatase 2C domain-containing protein [Enterovirga sp.]